MMVKICFVFCFVIMLTTGRYHHTQVSSATHDYDYISIIIMLCSVDVITYNIVY